MLPHRTAPRICLAGSRLAVQLLSSASVMIASPAMGETPSTPVCRVAFSPGGDGLTLILRELKGARRSVDVGMFYLSDASLIEALCFLSSRGDVRVRVFADSEMGKPAQRPILEKLSAHGARVFVENLPRDGKLHLKCAVIDSEKVITGSANWTSTAFDQNIEDVVVVGSEALALQYLVLFDSLEQRFESLGDTYGGQQRSVRKFPETKPARPTAGAMKSPQAQSFADVRDVQVYFTPGAAGLERFLDQARAATSRVAIAKYLLNEPMVVSALCEIARSGKCHVSILTDQVMTKGGPYLSALQELWDAGAAIDYTVQERSIMHFKAVVVDDRYVWTGSANWTPGAKDKNIEDAVLFDAPAMARHYAAYMETVRRGGRSFAPLSRDTLVAGARGSGEAESIVAGAVNTQHAVLPQTGPRTNWSDAVREAGRKAREKMDAEACVEYVDDGEYLPVVLQLIRTACQSILVTMFAVPGRETEQVARERLFRALADAVRRDVYVRLVLHTPVSPNDALGPAHSDLAERLRAMGIDVRLVAPTAPLHEKMVVVDAAKIVIGSHNWSEGALTGKRVHECSALIVLPRQDHRFADYVMQLDTITDMRSKAHWEQEIALFRNLRGATAAQRREIIRQLEAVTGGAP